jgi:hypothetical protein
LRAIPGEGSHVRDPLAGLTAIVSRSCVIERQQILLCQLFAVTRVGHRITARF